MTKIALIGAGSTVFSLNLIRDLCLTPSLRGSSVHFMDINPARLDAVHALCSRYAAEVRIQLDLQKTTDRRAALAGADFVINTALTAGYDRLFEGWGIARQRGYHYGGSLHVMHDEAFWINFYQLRFFESVVQDILDICPDAWLLQVGNPVLAGVTLLRRKYPQVRVVGLCHGFYGVYHLADALGLPHEGFTYEIPGVNHFVWLNRCFYKGEPVFPLLDEWIKTRAPAYWAQCGPGDPVGPKMLDLYQRFGVFPIGDTGSWGGGSWGWWYHTDAATERRWQEDPPAQWDAHFAKGSARFAAIERVQHEPSARVTEIFPPTHSHEIIVPMLESLACDIPRVLIGNVLNSGGYVPGIPHDLAVEVPTLVSARGIQPVQTTPLPAPIIAHALSDYVAPVNLELEAYTRRDRKLLLALILTDPFTRSERQARELLDAILALPYHTEMREHYR
jgi:alpha-galactosidase